MKLRNTSFIIASTLILTACGSGGGATTTTKITGTVPGTLIEAYGDNGSYYSVESTKTTNGKHPFELEVPAGLGLRLVMITNEGTADEVTSPIGFLDNTGTTNTRLILSSTDVIDLGHINIPTSRNAAAARDLDNDGILDQPYILDNDQDSKNPLTQTDVDGDGQDDFNDSDHGGYQYSAGVIDPLDEDGDGIPNHIDVDRDGDGIRNELDADFDTTGDQDHDGLNDIIDANPGNLLNSNRRFKDDNNADGYHDDDINRDGYHESDLDRDGYQDDDKDHDGFSDSDLNHDGFREDDQNRDGFSDSDLNHDAFRDDDQNRDGFSDSDLDHNGFRDDD